jgi:hypothetical protein
VTEAHKLALGELAGLHGTARPQADVLLRAAATLKSKASSLLGELVVDTTPASGNSSSQVFAQLAGKEAATVEASVATDAVGTIVHTIDAGGSLLATVTADQVARVRARVNADLGQAQVNAGSSGGSQNGSLSGSASATIGGAGANGSANVSAGAGLGAPGAGNADATIGLGL